MVWTIYISTGLFAVLMLLGLSQLKLKKLEDEYRQIDVSKSILFKAVKPVIQIIAAYIQKADEEKINLRYKKRLLISGNPLHLIPVEFVALKWVSAIAGLLIGIFLFFTIEAKAALVFCLAIASYFLPNLWLQEVIVKRKHAIFLELPFCMDLLTLAVEAGLSFRAGITKVVQKGPPGPLRDEFEKMLQDLRLGVVRRDALADLAGRTDMYEIRSFTSALIQAEKLGTPIGNALRTQAEIRRTERFQKAEKAAQEAPVRMLMPLLLFIFPAVFIVILVPILLKFMAEGM